MSHSIKTMTGNSARISDAISPLDHETPLRILVVDDQEVNRSIVVSILEARGCRTETANNGREAVSKWEHGGFDLILMDIHMPLIDGVEATWIIRALEKERGGHTSIVACSADYVMKGLKELSCAGFDGFVRKPLVFKELMEEMQRCLKLRRCGPA